MGEPELLIGILRNTFKFFIKTKKGKNHNHKLENFPSHLLTFITEVHWIE